jgi:CO/xanthine dehydrogenase Mo-binding subunit
MSTQKPDPSGTESSGDERTDERAVGESIPGADERTKVRGETVYADDFDKPAMLHGAVARSQVPAARIVEVDTSAAREMDGVEAVLTAEDVPNNESVTNIVGQPADVGLLQANHVVLADDVVRYFGEPVALIAAESRTVAKRAADRVDVTYEEVEGVYDPETAMADDAPKVHGQNNVIARWKLREGDVERGFEEADVVVENEYETQFQEHAHLEPESGVGWIDDDDVLNLRVATQVIEQYREIAEMLDVPESKVRVRGTIMGGGFGGKEDLNVEPFIALLVWETERPVKLTYDRDEMFFGRHKRSPFTLEFKHGATEDGDLVAMEARLVSDSGAYVYLSPWILLYACYHSTGPYDIPNVSVDAYSALTNNTFGSAFRSFGAMEATVGVEQQMDELARELDMDPRELRRKNYLSRGDATATGRELETDVALERTQREALSALGERAEADDGTAVGRGFASSWQSYGRMCYLHDMSSAWISLEKDGSAVVRSGIPDLGGGQRESLKQIASEELGVPVSEIQVNNSDTQSTPLGGTVTATRGLYMSGNAVRTAARDVREDVLGMAADMLGVDVERLTVADHAVATEDGTASVELPEVVQECHSRGNPLQGFDTFRAPTAEPITDEVLEGRIFPDFTFSTQAAEVEVDEATGKVTVTKLASAHDVGTAINPARVEGQIEGGAVQGLGYTLMENYELDDGVPLTRNLADYQLPCSDDMPDISSIVVESGTGLGPYGAKGIGEPAITATPAAILNAIRDAVGSRITKLPADPEAVYGAMLRSDD